MEELFDKIKEYLKMDTEISYQEFAGYYKKVMDHLQANFENMSKEDNVKTKFILTIVSSNSAGRAQRKGPEMKKYKKIQEKCTFWADAIKFHLKDEGMSQQEIDEAVDKISKDNE